MFFRLNTAPQLKRMGISTTKFWGTPSQHLHTSVHRVGHRTNKFCKVIYVSGNFLQGSLRPDPKDEAGGAKSPKYVCSYRLT